MGDFVLALRSVAARTVLFPCRDHEAEAWPVLHLRRRADMKTHQRTENITRETIMMLLSDDEVARVSTAETAAKLGDGDEYVDLEEPDRGVQRASAGTATPMGEVLPRKGLHEKTWRQIVALVSAHKIEAAHSHPS